MMEQFIYRWLYDMPNTVNLTTVEAPKYGLLYLNGIMGGWLFLGVLLAFYFLILFGYSLNKNDWVGGIGVAGITVFILSTLLWLPPLHIIDNGTMVTMLGLGILGSIFLWLPKRET